ncbi:hypothetical protein L208DRAFT_1556305, partial [Tricholoma matsutake]
MEFLWVQWFGMEPGYRWGFKTARLPKIGFVPDTDKGTFGFLDPSLVIRGCHLVPCFANGRTSGLLHTSTLTAAHHPDESEDWANYYVMIFVDRDMFMQYAGGRVGHAAATEIQTSNDNDAMEVDDDTFMVDADQVRNDPELKDSQLLDELRRVVEGEMAGDREVEDLMDDDNGEADDVSGEDDGNTTSKADSEEE